MKVWSASKTALDQRQTKTNNYDEIITVPSQTLEPQKQTTDHGTINR